jgi:hypothetical protein
VDCLVGLLVGVLFGWLLGVLIVWLVLVGCLVDWWVRELVGGLVG